MPRQNSLLANVFTILILLLLFSSVIFSNSYAQTTRNPVLEYVTGTWCTWCPEGHRVIKNSVLPALPNAIVLGYHGPANLPSEPMSFFEGNSIIGAFGFSGYPTGIAGRTSGIVDRSEWLSRMNQRASRPATVDIQILREYDVDSRKLSLLINLTALTQLSGLYKYNAILVENGLVFPDFPQVSGGADYVHSHVVRSMMNGALGENVIDGTWGQHQTIAKTFNYTVPQEFFADSCKIVVLVYKAGNPLASNAEIQQAEKIDLYAPRAIIESLKDRGAIAKNDGPVNFETALYNTGVEEDEFTISLNFDGPPEWQLGFETIEGSFDLDGSSVVSIPSNDSTLVNVSVHPNGVEGFGQTELSFVSNSDPKVKGHILLRTVTTNGSDILVIDENSKAKNDTLISQSLSNFYNGSFAVVDRDALDPINTNLSNFKVLVWAGGDKTTAFFQEETELLSSYLDNGGKLFIAGQNIGKDIFEEDGKSQHAQDFYHNYLHAKYVQDASTKKLVRGISGDPISSGVSLVLTDYFQRSPDIIAPADTNASKILTYATGPEVAGIKAQTENYKIVYLAIGLEQIKKETSRDSILAKSLRWLTYKKPGAGKSFYVEIDTTHFYGNVGEFYDLYSNIHNSSSDSLQLTIVRKSSDLPDGWFGALCVGELCFAPVVDTIFVGDMVPTMAPNDVLDFHLQVGASQTVPGSGSISIEIKDTKNPSDIVDFTFVFTTFPTKVDNKISIVESFELNQNYPNPFNPESKIRYSIPEGHTHVSLKIYNETGQLIRTLVNQTQAAGQHEVTWNGRNGYNQQAPSGIYFYKLQNGQHVATRKMILMR